MLRQLSGLFALTFTAAVGATEYVVPVGDVAGFFSQLPKDATSVVFSAAAVYKCDSDIVLPDAQLLIIDGRGCRLVLGPNSNGFTRRIVDQNDASQRTGSRYEIRDFAAIEGGRKAIDLQATLGSVVRNLRLMGQSEVAIDLRFALLTRIENVLVTNPGKQGIVVRTGDWPGANWSNSQSNHTVLEQCRVYSSATTTQAFTVFNCNGVRMSDCISEGAASDHDLFLSAAADGMETTPARNTVVKEFSVSNFHIEHATRKASIHVNMPPKCNVELSHIYWNGPHATPVIDYVCGQLNLSQIGWWGEDFIIATRISAPRINVDRSHSALSTAGGVKGGGKRAGVFVLKDALPGNDVLRLDYVRIARASQ